ASGWPGGVLRRAARTDADEGVLMQVAGAQAEPSNQSSAVPVTDDEIREKYLERAIRELNDLTRELQECEHCPRGNVMPVLGSGHPRADVLLLKHSASVAEIEEGVAFYGRSGNAITKSLKRLSIDPLAVYGTLCVKCPLEDPSLAGGDCVGRIVEELMIVEPRVVVVMGEPALAVLNDVDFPLARRLEALPGQLQPFTPTVDAVFTPDVDESLDSDAAKREFWQAFRVLGEWYADLPPY
ncbi:MAG: uracil-DNA glycosylase family protein, partial [Solirubrobacterales bacterium]